MTTKNLDDVVTYTVERIEHSAHWGKIYHASFGDLPAVARYEKAFCADIMEHVNAGKTVLIKKHGDVDIIFKKGG